MSKHTPGPWFWSQGVDDWELVGADVNRVLFCWNDSTKWKSGLIVGENIKQADATLIAATPDMAHALACAVAATTAEDWARAVDLSRAALAKAGLTPADPPIHPPSSHSKSGGC